MEPEEEREEINSNHINSGRSLVNEGNSYFNKKRTGLSMWVIST